VSKVVVMGSINMDVVAHTGRHPVVGETVLGTALALVPGGKGANQAVAASRLAAPTELVGRVGSDVFATMVLDFLSTERISGRGVRRLPNVATGTAIVVVDGAGDNTIVVLPGANHCLTVADAYDLPIERNDVVVLQFELPLEVVHAALSRARAIGARSVLNPAPAQACASELLALADVLVVNQSELAFFAGAGASWDTVEGPGTPAVSGPAPGSDTTSGSAGGPGPLGAGASWDTGEGPGTPAASGPARGSDTSSGPDGAGAAWDTDQRPGTPAASGPARGSDTTPGPAGAGAGALGAGGRDTAGDLRRLRRRPEQVVIATLGAGGAMALIGDHVLTVPGRVVPAVDTTGAGDCFVGALAAALCSSAEVAEAVHFANLAASLAVQRHGAGTGMPYLADIEALA